LRLDEVECDENIVFIRPSETLFMSDDFFKTSTRSTKSFPVEMRALRMSWFFKDTNNDNNGLQLLKAIFKCDKIEYFRNRSVILITEFLYLRVKRFLLYYLTPLYILNNILFMTLANMNENYRSNINLDNTKEIVLTE